MYTLDNVKYPIGTLFTAGCDTFIVIGRDDKASMPVAVVRTISHSKLGVESRIIAWVNDDYIMLQKRHEAS